MAGCLNQVRVGNKPTGVTAFATAIDARMYRSQKCRRYKTAGIGVIVTHAAFSLCRDVINRLRRGNPRVMTGRAIAVYYTRIMVKSASEGTKAVVDDVAR